MTDPYVRQDIWTLEQQQPWHPITEAYALAVGELQARSAKDPNDPTGWEYQGAVHGTLDGADQWRDQCQHNSWFFLPWHRMYLYWFERIVRSVVRSLIGVDDTTKQTWALPYWNYDNGGSTNTLPLAFRQPTMPNGDVNPLYVGQRDPTINAGGALPPQATSAQSALRHRLFSGPSVVGATVGFGGPPTGWHHFDENGTSTPGGLESTPHNVVHGIVGGDGGLMSDFNTAALDPIFWLHHANIDRLWTVWLAQPGRVNPTDATWTKPAAFHFHDEHGQDVTNVPSDVLDPSGSLGYTYTQLPTPVSPTTAPPPAVPHLEVSSVPAEPPPDHPAELVGATAAPVELTGEETALQVGMSPPSGPLAARAARAPVKVYLNIEDIQAERNPGLSYAVYVNPPDGTEQSTRESYYAGTVSFFGIERAADLDRDHPGGHGGLRYVFDITDLVARLRAEGRWNDRQLTVSLSPLRALPPAGPGVADRAQPAPPAGPAVPVRIGRVSVFYQ